jgi:hypothetical protein
LTESAVYFKLSADQCYPLAQAADGHCLLEGYGRLIKLERSSVYINHAAESGVGQ